MTTVPNTAELKGSKESKLPGIFSLAYAAIGAIVSVKLIDWVGAGKFFETLDAVAKPALVLGAVAVSAVYMANWARNGSRSYLNSDPSRSVASDMEPAGPTDTAALEAVQTTTDTIRA